MALKVQIQKRLAHFVLQITFEAVSGELVVLIGPSGAGKTTIMRMLAGLEKPDQGRISFGDHTWVDTDTGIFIPARKRGLGYVFQDYHLFPHLSIYRNVAFAASNKHLVNKLMADFGIRHLADRRPSRISGGERQRAAICQALARKPGILLLDEPFSSLDQPTRKRLQKELIAFKRSAHMPIVHVTHDLSEALYLGDQILPIVAGSLTPEWLDERLKDLMQEHKTVFAHLYGASLPKPNAI